MKAQCRLKDLEGKMGYTVLGKDKAGPTLVSVSPMETWLWRRIQPGGKQAVFELVGRENETAKPTVVSDEPTWASTKRGRPGVD